MKTTLKAAACLCAGIMSLSAMSAMIAADTTAAGDQVTASSATERKAPKTKNVKVGKVTAVNGSEITLALGEFSRKQADETKTPKTDSDGKVKEKPAAKPASKPEKKSSDTTQTGDTTTTATEDTTTEKTDKKPAGKHGRKGAGAGEFTETGDTLTVTLTDSITLQKNGKTITAAEISAGDILTLEYNDSNELVKIKAANTQSGKGKADKAAKDKSARKTKKTAENQAVSA